MSVDIDRKDKKTGEKHDKANIAGLWCGEIPLQAGDYFRLQINDALPSSLPRPHSPRNHHNSHSRNHPDGHSPKHDKVIVYYDNGQSELAAVFSCLLVYGLCLLLYDSWIWAE